MPLDPQMKKVLDGLAVLRGAPMHTLPVDVARLGFRPMSKMLPPSTAQIASVVDRSIEGPAGALPLRIYTPSGRAPFPVLMFFHGGGFVIGDLDSYDGICREICDGAGCIVVSVDYRLAPEHRFPAAVEDALAAFRWAVREAEALGCDPSRVAVAGDSAGGNLAAVVAQLATRGGGPSPALQVLFYPVTDVSQKHPSYRLFADGFFLTEREMDWYRSHYLPAEEAARDVRVSPLLAPDLRGLAPAVLLTAGFDVLRDEGEAYARRLAEAGVPVRHRRHASLIHGFCNATGVSRPARAAMDEATRWIGEALAAGARTPLPRLDAIG